MPRARAVAVSLEGAEGACAEKTVAADALAADNALEQERPVALLHLAERGDGGERVAGELAIDRDDGMIPGQRGELVERRAVRHRCEPGKGGRLELVYPREPQSAWDGVARSGII